MKKRFFFLVIYIIITVPTSSQLRLDYYYDQSEMYTKFSDWIPKKLHQWHPVYVEDFFLLYSLKNYYNTQELKRNIFFLEAGLKRKFRHPSQALCKITNEPEYHKYRLLIFMHINLKIMRSYLRIGSKFDKRHLYFYNLDFADDLKKSFAVAEYYYKKSIPYWEKARQYAAQASVYPFELDMGTLESIRHEIMTGKINFEIYTQNHLQRLKQKQDAVNNFLAHMNEQ